MNKKILVPAVLFCAVILFGSCADEDNDNTVSEEWKAYNEKQVRDASSSGYAALESYSRNGSVYWKPVDDFVKESAAGEIADEDKDRTPIFSDSVSIRYEGWFYQLDGEKYTFDSTEGGRNGIPYKSGVYKFVDGFSTMLQRMRIDEQVEVCIPYMLGYGAVGSYSNNAQIIQGYTTLWFRIKLMNIYDETPGVKAWVRR
jgi:FKBP-type peptidyl-prolyl cis-trans isomerase